MDYDILQVGYGPVGQTMAALLGQSGHRVGVLERHGSLYGLPRAGHVDHEIMRAFQKVGAADAIAARAWPMTGYDILDAEGQLLQALDWNHNGISGWHSDYLMYQPYVESALDERVRAHESVEVHFGTQVESIRQLSDRVEVTYQPRAGGELQTVSARFVIGADGANSTVREMLGIERQDLGFSADWLVLDVRPHDPQIEIDMPNAGQICDPARPISLFRWLGLEHCRWEFMLLPTDRPKEMNSPEAVWRLLARWGLTPDNSDLIRHTVYTFRSLIANRFHDDRVALIGDAAHLMPPFMGQGMCSGIRDALTLAWRLELLISGDADQSLLDSYTTERRPHAEAVVRASMALGNVVCTLDRDVAAARDAMFRSGQAPPPEPFPGLTAGVLDLADADACAAVGSLSPQGRVSYAGREGRFDDVVGSGWLVITQEHASVDGSAEAVLSRLGGRIIELGSHDGQVEDLDGTYSAWLESVGAAAVLVRPDFYVFGVVSEPTEVSALIDRLGHRLGLLQPQPAHPR